MRYRHSIIAIIMIAFGGIALAGSVSGKSSAAEAGKVDAEEYAKLLSRIDTDYPGLERVKAMIDDPSAAVENLLQYFRSAKYTVKHPDDTDAKPGSASRKDIEIADNALKHIFIGQSSYPPVFCGDDINWATSPVPDNEWVWQLNRMGFWSAMGRVYRAAGDEKYAKAWAEQLKDWVRKNPNDAEHKYAWRSIEAGIRGYRWTGLFRQFIDSPSFTPDVLAAFLNSCFDHASYLMTKYSTRSNWGLMEAEGMAFIAVMFPMFKDAEKWKTEAIDRLSREIDIQVYPDGHQRELTLSYHIGCIDWFWNTYKLAKINGFADKFPASYPEKIEKMCEVPMKIALPDGTHPQFGDDWAGTPGQHENLFRAWAELFRRPDFLYLATEGKSGECPDKTAFALPESGIYSMRSGWNKDATCLVLKCGPDGGWHCQPDNGTFVLYAGGRNLMPDGGSYIYSGDPENRNWFRQTKTHQTLTLDNRNSRYAPQLLLWSPGETLDILVVENAGYDNLTHRRAVFFVDKKYFVIVDEAFGPAVGEIGLHFQLAPGKAVFDKKNYAVRSAFDQGPNVSVRAMSRKGMRLEEEEGRVSFEYTIKEPRPAFCFRTDKNTAEGIRFVTTVVPYASDKIPEVDVKFPETAKPGSPVVKFIVNDDSGKKEIGYTLNDK